jgi:hypothetical protein
MRDNLQLPVSVNPGLLTFCLITAVRSKDPYGPNPTGFKTKSGYTSGPLHDLKNLLWDVRLRSVPLRLRRIKLQLVLSVVRDQVRFCLVQLNEPSQSAPCSPAQACPASNLISSHIR